MHIVSPFPLVPVPPRGLLGTRNVITLSQVLHDPSDKSHRYVVFPFNLARVYQSFTHRHFSLLRKQSDSSTRAAYCPIGESRVYLDYVPNDITDKFKIDFLERQPTKPLDIITTKLSLLRTPFRLSSPPISLRPRS